METKKNKANINFLCLHKNLNFKKRVKKILFHFKGRFILSRGGNFTKWNLQ